MRILLFLLMVVLIQSSNISQTSQCSSLYTQYQDSTNHINEKIITKEENTCGPDLIYSYQNSALIISGSGPMTNYTNNTNAVWHQNQDLFTTVVISEGVTSIGDYAFYEVINLTSISISNTVTLIGSFAFYGCQNLTSILIPNSVEKIEPSSFSYSSLNEIEIPEKVTKIEDYLFDNCKNLESITFHGNVKIIGIYSFNQCTNLRSISIPSSVDSIGSNAFSRSGLYTIEFPKNLKIINQSLLYGCSNLYSVKFLGNVEQIFGAVFYLCVNLTSISIPRSVVHIDTSAFCRSGLYTIEFPENIKRIDFSVLEECSNLYSVKFLGNVERIEPQAFYHCVNLTSISIPRSVVYIGNNAFYMSGLYTIEFPENLNLIDHSLLQKCSNLYSVKFLGNIEKINPYAFNECTNLTSLTFLGSLSYIDEKAFNQCSNIKQINYYGLTNPSTADNSFSGVNPRNVYVTRDYKYDNFCGFRVAIFPTQYFSQSDEFTLSSEFSQSGQFSKTYEFSYSNIFSKSDMFTKSTDFTQSKNLISHTFSKSDIFTRSSLFTKSNLFSESDTFLIQKVVPIATQKVTSSMSFSISYVYKRSVTHSISYVSSNTFIFSYIGKNETFSFVISQTDYIQYYPYIIHYYSITYLKTIVQITLFKKKTISPEQLIGAVCGSVAVFFLVLALIILIVRKKQYTSDSVDFDISDSEDSVEIINKSPVIDNSIEVNKSSKDFPDDINEEFSYDNDESNIDHSSLYL